MSIKNNLSPEQLTIDVAIYTPLVAEYEYLKEIFKQYDGTTFKVKGFDFKIHKYKNVNLLIAHTGIGTTFTASIMTMIIQNLNPKYHILVGTAGGIAEHLKINDVVVAVSAFEAEIQGLFAAVRNTVWEPCLMQPLKNKYFPASYSVSPKLLDITKEIKIANFSIHTGQIVTSNAFPAPIEFFQRIRAMKPLCIDMETSAFYQTAWLYDAKPIAIRGISNILNQEGKDEKINEADIFGSIKNASLVALSILDKLT